ncbi:MAG: hypothetical protein K9H62_21375 [Bacteroidales bacterium]|nr:hypothetical protein [Bacteroidales bacterium]
MAPHHLGFGIHSPSLFDFLMKVVFDSQNHDEYHRIEGIYPARICPTKKKYGRLICRIIKNAKPGYVLEITSMPSLMSLYLAAGSNQADFFCINECYQQGKRIQHLAEIVNPGWIDMNGSIEKILPVFLNSREKWDVFYLNYFSDYGLAYSYFELLLPYIHADTIIIIDLIHYSLAADQFWQKIISHSEVRQSVDLFEIGILFFHDGLQKEDFVVRV